MKKVLAIAPYTYLPYYSGGQKSIARFLHHLGQQTDLAVISVAENDCALATTYEMIPLLKNSFSRYYDTKLVKKITVVIKERGIKTVIWEHPYYAWLAFRIRKKTGVKTIIHTHNIEYQRFKSTGRWWWPFLKWYEKWCLRKADGIFFTTPEDKQFAVNKWKIEPSKCFNLPFGIEIKEYPADRSLSKQEICKRHHIFPDEKILLFTGALAYKPNLDAQKIILEKINPLLMAKSLRYKIIICGKGLPAAMNNLEVYKEQHIIHAGFAADIENYYKAADVMLNPVLSGGGVKTKVVEAIAYGATVISTATGAAGVDSSVCGNKLITVADNDWEGLSGAIISKVCGPEQNTPPAYYRKYHWDAVTGNIIMNAI
jgi:glycosyltransferase involved in cell wall biosynthesis